MELGKQKRRKHQNRRYLTNNDTYPSIPKQSRKRWLNSDGTDYNVSYNGIAGNRTSSTSTNLNDVTTTTTIPEEQSVPEFSEISEEEVATNELRDFSENTAEDNADPYDDYYFRAERHPYINSEEDDLNAENFSLNNEELDDRLEKESLVLNFEDETPTIPNGDEHIFADSDITKGQAIVVLISFILRHHLTSNAVEDLLEIFNLLAPGCLPPTKFLLTKGISVKGNGYDAHLFCPHCDVYLEKYSESDELHHCKTCNSQVNREECLKNGNFFLYIPIETQLKEIMRRHPVIKKSDFLQDQKITGVFSGRIVKEHFQKGELLDDDITLIWNCDGAPGFHSSKRSIWPLQAYINEIPHKSKENLLLIGLWFAKEKPWSHCYLKPFVDELKHLGTVDS